MVLADTSTENLPATEDRVIAFFKNKEDAYGAITQLRDAGFTSSEIGLMAADDYEPGVKGSMRQEDESFWQKLKDFFTGESHDDVDYRDTSSGMSWDQDRADYYYGGIHAGGALVSVTGRRIEKARRILEHAGGDLRESGFEPISKTEANAAEEVGRIQLRGEMLRTYKERVQRGEVRLRKDVITENQSVQVPVTREELVVERVPATGEVESGEVGADEEVRVPISEERVRTEKEPVVTGEVRVSKRSVQNTENVSDSVRSAHL